MKIAAVITKRQILRGLRVDDAARPASGRRRRRGCGRSAHGAGGAQSRPCLHQLDPDTTHVLKRVLGVDGWEVVLSGECLICGEPAQVRGSVRVSG